MPKKIAVKQGDGVTRLADQHGFFSETIWNHADNADLKKLRKQMDVLMPGDTVIVPDLRPKKLPCATEERHRFQRKGIPAILRLQIVDRTEPRANQSYRLVVDGVILRGTTDATGTLEEYVPATAQSGALYIGPDEHHIALDLGHLDPVDELTGVQKRLNNLGYHCGEPNGEINDDTRRALQRFQRATGLSETGENDEATLQRLSAIHDQVNDPEEFRESPTE